jgi:serine protease Do
LLFAGIVWNNASKIPYGFYEPSPHVRLEASGGLGSGVHIGNGLVITAAHVVSQNKSMKVFGDDNRVLDEAGEVLWSNAKYDVALIRLHKSALKAAPLSCAPNFTSQAVWAYGNPMGVRAVYTKGEVVGPAREWSAWASVVPVSGPIIYGQSGGGVLDADGGVVGIAVGLLMTPAGIASFGWIVPARVVCDLMGRA